MTDTRTLKHTVEQVATWYPEKTAFVQAFEDRRVTFAEADARMRRIANGLADHGVGHGDRVAILADPSIEHAVTFFGAQKLGAVPSTLHVRESPATLAEMVRDLGARAVVFDHAYADVAERLDGDDNDVGVCVEYGAAGDGSSFAIPLADFEADADDAEPDVEVTPDGVAFVNFSSGTTGRPKGIVHTHEEAVEACHNGQYMFSSTDRDTLLNASTPSFIAWKILTFPIVSVGGTVVFMGDWQPDRVADVVDAEAVTLLNLVPTQWKMVAQHGLDAEKFASLRMAGYGGEPMGVELFEQLREHVSERVTAQFGTTETINSGLCLLPHRVTEEALESIGRPAPNVDVRIVDPDTRDPADEVDRGEVGELIVRGPAVAERVWNDPEKTAEIFHEDGWWLSGDLAERRADGNVYLRGRTDNMIISGGINIYAEGVEAVVEGHPAVAECAVIGVPDEEWGERVTAYVVTDDDDLTAADLDEWCLESDDLSDYQRPRAYEFVDDLPRTNTGKLNRAGLREHRVAGEE